MTMPHQTTGHRVLTMHDIEVERRLTRLEEFATATREALAKMDKRQTLQERGMLLLFISITALAHERIPWLAKALMGLIKTAPV